MSRLQDSFSSSTSGHRLNTKIVKQLFKEKFADKQAISIVRAPGRINLIGDHTDYNAGFALPITLDRGVWVALRKRCDSVVNIYSVNFNQSISYRLQNATKFRPDSWSACVSGVLEELCIAGYLKQGLDAVIVGDVPLGSGLSSSAATEIAVAVGIEDITASRIDPIWMIKMSQHVEHKYIGLKCGIMDQFVSRLGQKKHAMLLDCNDLSFSNIPIDLTKVAIIYAHSGVSRQLANSVYNDRRKDCQDGVNYFKQFNSLINSLRDITLDQLYTAQNILSEQIFSRCHHVITENQRVIDAAYYFKTGDFFSVGQLMNQSHTSLCDNYKVSLAQVDQIINYVQKLPAVYGARMTGAGFGGCLVALVDINCAQQAKTSIINFLFNQGVSVPMVEILSENFQAGVMESNHQE